MNTTLGSYGYTAVSAHYIPVNSRADIVLNMTLWSYGYTAVSAHYIPVNGRADIVLNTPYGAIVLMKKSSRGRGVLEFFFLLSVTLFSGINTEPMRARTYSTA